MPIFEITDTFKVWVSKLDKSVRRAVNERLDYAETSGHLGKLLKGTGGIYEIAMDTGPGYRLYHCRGGEAIYWLLVGGIKKDQMHDIERAMAIRDDLKRSGYGKAH